MNRHLRAFTIVELIIVITVIGILVGIATVSWGNTTRRVADKAHEDDVKQWMNTFDVYKSRFAVWPALPSGTVASADAFCLGAFPDTNNKCVQYKTASAFNGTSGTYVAASGTPFNDMKAALERVGKYPENGGKKLDDFAGPFVFMVRNPAVTPTTVDGFFLNFFTTCPSGFTRADALISSAKAAKPTLASHYDKLTTLLGSSATSSACGVMKTLTYGV